MLKPYIILFSFLFSHQILFAQQGGYISGIVNDKESGEPLPFANVFFNNSTIGTTTNEKGEFILEKLRPGNHKLIVSYIGYQTHEQEVEINPKAVLRLKIVMPALKNVLDEVKVTAKQDKEWAKLIRDFEDVFLGNGKNAKLVKILNPGVIDLSREGGTLKASSFEPILIENNFLGYIVHYYLKEFSVGQEDFHIEGYARFEEIKHPTNQQKVIWIENRGTTYKGSLQHFLKSCIESRIADEGFRIYFDTTDSDLPLHLARRNLFSEYEKMLTRADTLIEIRFRDSLIADVRINKRLEIHYLNSRVKKRYYPDVTHQVSRIFVRDSILRCLSNGIIADPNYNWTLWGDMALQRIGDLLPIDYSFGQSGNLQVSGRILDAQTKKGIQDANIFINQSTIGTFTSAKGFYAFTDIPEGFYDLLIFKRGYSPFVSRLRIESGKNYSINLEMKPEDKNKAIYSRKTREKIPDKKKFIRTLFKITPQDSCVINNLESLELTQRSDGDYIFNEEALTIENKLTGYQVLYYVLPFNTNFGNDLLGYYWFKPMTPKSQLELNNFESNRLKNFQGSARHLLSAIVNGGQKPEGFALYDKNGLPVSPDIDTVQNVKGYFQVDFKDVYRIEHIRANNVTDLYNKLESSSSRLIRAANPLLVNAKGTLFNSNSLSLLGSMYANRLPLMLPLDYEPPLYQSIWSTIPNYQESVTIQTSKEYYQLGEDMFFKAFLHYTNQSLKDSLSRVLYVELINFRKEIIYQKSLQIDQGAAAGSFLIPKQLAHGTYMLRAYTNWMRNFDKPYFQKSIQVLAVDTNYKIDKELNAECEKSSVAEGLEVSILSSKNVYNRRERIEVQILVKDSSNSAITADFSCSVVDADIVACPIIKETEDKSKNRFSGILRYPIERALNIKGKVLNSNDKISRLQFINLKNQLFEETSADSDGNFELFLPNFFDSLNLTVVGFQENIQFKPEIKLSNRDMPTINSFTQEVPNNVVVDEKLRIANQYFVEDKTIVLEEVEVRGSKMQTSPQSKISLIKPEKIIKTDDLQNFGGNLLLGLQGKIPGVDVRCQGIDCQIFISRASGGSIMFSKEPLVLLNGIPMYGQSAGSIIGSLDQSMIERIEIQKSINVLFGLDGRNGIIALYTKTRSDNSYAQEQSISKIQSLNINGYSNPYVFSGPNYNQLSPDMNRIDYRTTLYWNPLLKTNATNEKVSIAFFAADIPTTYRIQVEGFTSSNKHFRVLRYVHIK